MTRNLFIVTSLLLATAVPTQAAPRPLPGPHGPPDTFSHMPAMCALPRGGSCSTGPFVRSGERCFCDGPQGLRYGEVVQK